ncbi:hypothetical protein ACF0H5_018905 [Mactra antiquata]
MVDTIMRNARNLAGTRYAVDRDYPIEVRTARKKLWPIYKDYRTNKNNRVSLRYPVALVVNDRVVCNKFPYWDDIMNSSANISFSHTLSSVSNQVNVSTCTISLSANTRDECTIT